ncbi:MAG: hypothetical protein AAF290_09880 [Pseudomonadota bacterium]
MMTSDDSSVVDWSRDTQKLAVIAWVSFLTAAVMTLVCFAFVDPLLIIDALADDNSIGREAGYSVGFFFFWIGCLVSSWLTARLIRRKRRWPQRVVESTR